MKKRVVVGMSGGVDSSVAAYLLKEAGYEVIGLFMRNWDSTLNRDVLGNPDLDMDICPQERDYQDAALVAKHIGIPLHRVEFIEAYWEHVFTTFLEEYRKGRTPNPDILCNKFIKFDAFSEHAKAFNPDYIAMGHYARVQKDKDVTLLRGLDSNKDQTYFLSQLTHRQLAHVLFPIGDLKKDEVRRIAKAQKLPVANKKDSTGICFIGERRFNEFLNNYLPAQSGPMVTEDGVRLGEHSGLMHYTIGQRKGLGIGGLKDYDDRPWFVIGKDLATNTLKVGQGFHHPDLYSTSCTLESLSLVNPDTDLTRGNITAKFRYRQADQAVRVQFKNGEIIVHFKVPIRAVTPGQACVFYDGDTCLGGGVINHVFKDNQKLPY